MSSGIENMFIRGCKQTCVYWANPINDGYNNFTYDDPVELKCRWEDRDQATQDTNGVTVLSRATVYLLQDVNYGGVLYLGTLASLSAYLDSSGGTYIDPVDLPEAFLIKRIERIPNINITSYLRKAFLTPWLT